MSTLMFALALFVAPLTHAKDDPASLVQDTANELLREFTAKRAQLEGNHKALFQLVERIASPLFDFDYISKLVLAKSWKQASPQQRAEFAEEFKRLIIVTYATALFSYTGNETMEFGESKIREKKGVYFGTVNTEVRLSDDAPVAVVYFLIRRQNKPWKIYNLSVGSLNMVLNYRNVIQSSIHSEGLDGVIAGMKENNDKNF